MLGRVFVKGIIPELRPRCFCYDRGRAGKTGGFHPSGVLVMEIPALPLGSRRNEDIALDLMKFIAMTTGYGKTIGTGVGFQGGGAAAKPEDYAAHLLELYGRCLHSVGGK
jgi:hypothetical protein